MGGSEENLPEAGSVYEQSNSNSGSMGMEKKGTRIASQLEPRQETETLVGPFSRGILYKSVGGQRGVAA